MGCLGIKDGFICGPDKFVNLADYGAKVWMEYHNHNGPTFYRSSKAIKPIVYPSPKTWAAYENWCAANQEAQ